MENLGKVVFSITLGFLLLFFVSGCSDGGDSFSPQTISWEQEGDEVRYFTNDAVESDQWHNVYFPGLAISGDFTVTQEVRKVAGSSGVAYGIMFVADWDNWIKFSICENGYFHCSWEESGVYDWSDWQTYAPLNTSVGTTHTLKMSYTSSSGELQLYYGTDPTPLYTAAGPAGASGYVGMSCYTGTTSQSQPYDYRFKVTAPASLVYP